MGGLFAPEDAGDAFVWGMWVAPEARGRGLGQSILRTLLEHAEQLGRTVLLHVTAGNDGARRLYEANGFEPTGEWEPLREGSPLQIELLRLCRA
jgi:ribosomal protein S18 acetylase RimI-like enzyme